MTNEEKIKQADTMLLAKLLLNAESGLIPKRYSCNELNCWFCKNDLCCYTEWLKKDYIEHHGDMEIGDYVENFDEGITKEDISVIQVPFLKKKEVIAKGDNHDKIHDRK